VKVMSKSRAFILVLFAMIAPITFSFEARAESNALIPEAASAVLLAGGARGFRDGDASNARFDFVSAMTIGSDDTLLIIDQHSTAIRRVTSGGAVSTLYRLTNSGPRHQFTGITEDGHGTIYVSDSEQRTIYRLVNFSLVPVAGRCEEDNSGGCQTGLRDGVGASARLYSPRSMTFDERTDSIEFVDENEIRRLSVEGRVTTVAGGKADGWADGSGTNARFSLPLGLVKCGKDGPLYVVDPGNFAIRTLDDSGTVHTIVRNVEAPGSGWLRRPFVDAPEMIACGATSGTVFTNGLGGILLVTDAGDVWVYSSLGWLECDEPDGGHAITSMAYDHNLHRLLVATDSAIDVVAPTHVTALSAGSRRWSHETMERRP